MDQKKPEISFIIVNYKSADYLKKCLASIWEKTGTLSFEVIVVNNDGIPLNSTDFKYPIKLINSETNGGFGKGSNLGAESSSAEILCFINPDTELSTDNLDSIMDEFRLDGRVGAIGPDIVDEKGNTRGWTSGNEITLGRLIRHNLKLEPKPDFKSQNHKSEVDWVSGACLFIRQELFHKIGGFDEKFFAYYEDVDLCKRIKNEGYKILRLPEIKVLHWEGKSFTDQSHKKKLYYESQKEYFAKHHGKPKAEAVDFLRKMSHR